MPGILNVSQKWSHRARGSPLLVFPVVLWLVVAPGVVCGGESTLRGFERDVTRTPAPHEHNTQDVDDSNEEDSGGGGFLGWVIDTMLGSHGSSEEDSGSDAGTEMQAGPAPPAQPVEVETKAAVEAPARMEAPVEVETPAVEVPPTKPYVWQPGSGFTPRLRVDYRLMRVSSHIGAALVGVEAGDDHFGLMVRDTIFEERDPDATLRVRDYYMIWRLPAEKGFEVDLGGGGTEVAGEDENSGLAYVARLRVKSQEGWVFEGRYGGASINGNDLSDGEVGASLQMPYMALTGGYRWLKSPHMLLDGPFVGISVRY